jgi:predicted small secreted protein
MIPTIQWQVPVVALVIVVTILLSGCTTAPLSGQDSAAKDWRLTLNGTQEKVLTMD